VRTTISLPPDIAIGSTVYSLSRNTLRSPAAAPAPMAARDPYPAARACRSRQTLEITGPEKSIVLADFAVPNDLRAVYRVR
jgi:hypothetical protein